MNKKDFTKNTNPLLALFCCLLFSLGLVLPMSGQIVIADGNGVAVQDFSTNTITIPDFSVPDGSDRLLVVAIDWVSSPSGASFVTNVTYNGQIFTHAVTGSEIAFGITNIYSSIWYLPMGSGCTNISGTDDDIIITLNNPTDAVFASAASFQNVNQVSPTGLSQVNNGLNVTSSNISLGTSNGNMIVDGIMALTSVDANVSQTVLLATSGTGAGASYKETTGSLTSMDWTMSSSSPAVVHVGVEFKKCSTCSTFSGPPTANATATTITCSNTTSTLSGSGSSMGANISYEWTKLSGSGNFVGASTNINAIVDGPGVFRLKVTDTMSGCDDTADVTVLSNTDQVVSDDNGVFEFDIDEGITGTINNFIVPEGCDRLLAVEVNWISVPSSNGAEAVTSITYNGQNLIEAVTHSETFSFTKLFSSIWYLPLGSGCDIVGVGPNANDINVTLNNSSTSLLYISASSFQNVDQTTPFGNLASNSGSAAISSISIPSANNKNMIIDAIMAGSTVTANATQTPIFVAAGAGAGASYEMGTGANVSMDWTQANPVPFVHIAAEIVNCSSCSTFPTPPMANASATVINCSNATSTLDGAGSSTGANISYEWTKVSGTGNLVGPTDGMTASADGEGVFRLTVTDTDTNCSAEADVTVTSDFSTPMALGAGSTITCASLTSMLEAAGSSTGADFSYEWTKVSGMGNLVGPTNGFNASADGGGVFRITVTKISTGCTAFDDVTVLEDPNVPVAVASATVLGCMTPTATLDGTGSSTGTNISYQWTKVSGVGNLVGATDGIMATVDGTGVFKLTVTNTDLSCSRSFDVAVTANTGEVVSDDNGVVADEDNDNISGDFDGDTNAVLTGFITPEGCDRLLVVSVNWISNLGIGGSDEVNSVTYNGLNFTEIETSSFPLLGSSVNAFSSLWHLPLGSGCMGSSDSEIIVTLNNSSTVVVFVGASTFQNVDQTNPVGNTAVNPGSGTNASISIGASPNSIVVDAIMSGQFVKVDSTISPRPPIYTTMPGSGASSSYSISNGGTVSMDWVLASSGEFAHVAAEIVNCSSCTNFPSPPMIAASATVITCSNPNSTLNGTGSSTGANISYEWTKVSGAGNLVGATDGIMATANGNGVFRLKVTDNDTNCFEEMDVTVTSDLTTPTVTATSTIIDCANPTSTLNGTGSSTGSVTYSWTKVSGTGDLVGATNVIMATADGPGDFKLTVTNDGNGCSDEFTVTVTEDLAAPMAMASSTLITCASLNSILSGAGSSAGLNFTYSWTKVGGIGNFVGGTNSINAEVDGTGDFKLTVTNTTNSCTAEATVTVIQDADVPVAMAVASEINCNNVNSVLNGTGSSVGTNITYNWIKVSGTGNFVGGTNDITAAVDGEGQFKLTVTNTDNGCVDETTVTVVENITPPTVVVNASTINCINANSTLSGAGSSIGGSFTYSWTKVSGAGDFVGVTNGINATVDGTGVFNLMITNTTNGCTANMDVTVASNFDTPTASTSATVISCAAPSSTLSGAGSSTVGVTYSWTKVSGSGNFVGATNGINATVDGTGDFKLTVTNSMSGCTDESTVSVTSDATIPTVVTTASLITCTEPNSMLNSAGSSTGGDFGYTWTKVSGSGNIVGAIDGTMATVNGTGVFKLTVTDTLLGCSNSSDVTVFSTKDQVSSDDNGVVADEDNDNISGEFDGDTTAVLTGFVIPEGCDRILVVSVNWISNLGLGGSNQINSITYNGENLTEIETSSFPLLMTPVNAFSSLWYLTLGSGCASTSDSEIIVELNNNSTVAVFVGASTFQNVDQTAPIGNTAVNAGSGTNPSINLSASANNIVVDAIMSGQFAKVDSTSNPRPPIYTTMPGSGASSSYSVSSGGTVSMDWVLAASGEFAQVAAELNNCATCTSFPTPPIADATATVITCADTTATLDGSASSANVIYAWTKVSGTGNIIGATDGSSATVDGTGTFKLTVIDKTTFCSAETDITVIDDITTPTATATSTLITCANPNSTLDGAGSTTTGVTYQWTKVSGSGSLVGATDGIMATADGVGVFRLTVTKTDNGCSASFDVTVTADSNVPTATGTATVIDCNNGDATLNGTGSSSGTNFTYAWTKVSGLGNLVGTTDGIMATVDSTGVFKLTVTNTDNGCTSSADITVTEDKTAPTVVVNASEINCNNLSSMLDGTGSSSGANYTYAWTKVSGSGSLTGATDGLMANVDGTGTFTLTITNTDNGCSASSNVDVIAIIPPDISVASQTNVGCFGDSTGVAMVTTANGKSPFVYAWSNGGTTATENGLPAGMYGVTVTDADGCVDSTMVNITQADSLGLDATSTFVTTIGGNDGTATVTPTGGTAPFNYLWSNDSTSQTISGLGSGYYTVTVTDDNSCQDTTGVLVFESLLVDILPDTIPFCEDGELGLTAITNRTVTYKWNTGSTVVNTVANSTGIYSVTVTDGFGNTAVASQFVETLPNPDVTITPDGPNQFCEGESVTLTASGGVSYAWDDDDNTIGASITVTATDGYTVIVTDSNGCTNSETFSVTAFELPEVAIESMTGFDFCEGETVTLDANVGTIVDFYWSTLDTNVMSIALDETTDVTLVVVDGNGCIDSTSVTVTERPLPTAEISPGTLIEFCKNNVDTVDLIASGGVQYQWSNGANTDVISVFGQNDYTVTVTDMFGCTDTESTSIVINSLPTASLMALGDTTFCDGGSVELAASGGLTYNWSTGETTQNINATNTATYTVTVTDGNGCTDTASQGVETIPFPDVVLSPIDTSFCEGGLAVLNVTTDPNTTLDWNTGQTSNSIQVNTSGTYSVVVTGANACSTTATTTVTVNPLPTITVSPTDTLVQAGQIVTLQASGGTSYSWSNGGSTSSINTILSGTFVVTGTDDNGCSSQATATVVVENAPIVAIEVIGSDEICEGETTTLNAIAAGVPPLAFEWSTGEISQSIDVSATGTYTVTVTDANGFSVTASDDITVFALPNAPQISPNNDQVLCEGDQVTLTSNLPGATTWLPGNIVANSIDVNTSGNYTAFTVDANGCQSVNSDTVNVQVVPLPLAPVISYSPDTVVCAPQTIVLTSNYATGNMWSNNSTDQSIEITLGNQSYSVVHTDANGCTSFPSDPVSVNILLQPNGSITIVGDTIICQDETVELIANGGASYAWNVPGPASQSITVSSSGDYIVTVTDDNGCTDVVSQTVVVNPLPMPEITQVGDSLFSDLAVSYQWYYNGVLLVDSTNQWIIPTQTGDYYVEVVDDNGCVGESFEITGTVELSDIATIEVFPIPAQNDLFVNLKLRKYVANIQVRMYNLVGQEVYSEVLKPQSDYLNHEIDLNNLPSGNYYLQFEVDGESIVQKVIKQ